MRSTRSITWLLFALVLVPTGILAWMGFQAADAFESAESLRLRTDLDSASRLLITLPVAGRQLEREIDGILAARAELLARDLPLLETHQALSHIASTSVDFLPLDLVTRRVRLIDAQGRPVYWKAYRPRDTAPDLTSGTSDDLLEALRREADRRYYGDEGLDGAITIWTRARAGFSTALRRAVADVEMARLLVRAGASPVEEARRLDDAWPVAVLARVGRTALLLWFDAARREPRYKERLARLWRDAALATTPLTTEERRRFAELLSGQSFAPFDTNEQWGIPFEHDVAGGARLRTYIATGSLKRVFQERLQARLRALPVDVDAGVLYAQDRPLPSSMRDGVEIGRMTDVHWPSGGRHTVWLAHVEADAVLSSMRTRRWLVTIGVIGLFGVSVLGLLLARRAMAREHAARRLRDDFIANVTHEVRTPLTSVLLHSELLLDPAQDEERKTAHAQVVQAEGQRLASLVDGLLDFSALESGTRRLEPGPVDLAAAAHEAIAPYRILADKQGRSIVAESANGECTGLADATGLSRVLANLVGNAWKHGGKNVRVVAGREFVEVRDDGPGIHGVDRVRVFERFKRGEASETTAGVGIGLSLARDLARAMDGELQLVWDRSETVFRLTLPPVPEMPS